MSKTGKESHRYNGVINIYKEKGYTSHDVVAKLRGILKMKKIGHTGTLDPNAQGVLPVCLGTATKLCDLLTEKEKIYETTLLLGKETDTQDSTGTILHECEVTVSESEVRQVIESFVGQYEQIPPMYSALKIDGKKLYELAREGKTVERKARTVEIYEITVQEIHLPRVKMRVRCSKGTYIRTLCHDIGEKLSCKGCMEELMRTKVSCFSLENSLTLAQVEKFVEEEKIEEFILPPSQVLSEYPACTIRESADKLLKNGNPLTQKDFLSEITVPKKGWVRVFEPNGEFAAVYEYREEKKHFYPVKMFLS